MQIKDDLPAFFADEKILEKVFEVLLQNTIDHVDKSKVRIILTCKTTEKEHTVSIKDNGVKIHPEHHDKIFKLFQIIDSTHSTGIEYRRKK
ncbi:ATP-binding protein [Polaribacter sp.]|nr:ATP-binding protein [Polaribacter sp.]|tara:strand:- start:7519 stop:7791 length:273 start_codon:yes stop_codon:yes gene_type:complete